MVPRESGEFFVLFEKNASICGLLLIAIDTRKGDVIIDISENQGKQKPGDENGDRALIFGQGNYGYDK